MTSRRNKRRRSPTGSSPQYKKKKNEIEEIETFSIEQIGDEYEILFEKKSPSKQCQEIIDEINSPHSINKPHPPIPVLKKNEKRHDKIHSKPLLAKPSTRKILFPAIPVSNRNKKKSAPVPPISNISTSIAKKKKSHDLGAKKKKTVFYKYKKTDKKHQHVVIEESSDDNDNNNDDNNDDNYNEDFDIEFEINDNKPSFAQFEEDALLQQKLEEINSSNMLTDFIHDEKQENNSDSMIFRIHDFDQFISYHDELQLTKTPIIYRGNDRWIVAAFSTQKKKLIPHKYYHVSKLSDGYTCSCPQHQYDTMSCLHQSIVELVIDNHNPTMLLFQEQDKYVREFEKDDIYCIETSDKRKSSSVWSVNCPLGGGISIVHINESHGAITCQLCKSSSKWCAHRNTLNKYIYEITGGFLDVKKIFVERKQLNKPKNNETQMDVAMAVAEAMSLKDVSCLSQKPIPIPRCFLIDDDIKNIDEKDSEDILEYYKNKPLHLKKYPTALRPKSCECPNCNIECEAVLQVENAKLNTECGQFSVDVYKRVCIECDYEKIYDGFNDGILWKNEKTFFSHALFNDWTVTRYKSSATLTSFHTSKTCIYYNNGCVNYKDESLFPSVPKFTESYEAFYRLQRWKRKLSCIYCDRLGQYPQIVGMDCTQICLKYERLQHIITPKESYSLRPDDEVVKMRNIVNKTPMVYINKYQLRLEAKRFLINKNIRVYMLDKNVKKLQKLKWTKKRTNKLFKDLRNAGCGHFVDLVDWFMSKENIINSKRLKLLIGDILRACANYVPLFKLSPNPVNSIAVIFDVDMMKDKEKLACISRYIPYFVLIFHGLKKEKEVEWPECMTNLIKQIANGSSSILSVLVEERSKTNGGKLKEMNEDEKKLFSNPNACGVITGLEPINIRPRYDFVSESDAYKKKKKKTPKIKGETETELVAECKKHFDEHAHMSCGALTANCLQHKQNFLASSLKEPESVDNYFSVIVVYYPGFLSPSDLVSDNPCNIGPYCIYREPKKFMDMQNSSDIFHGWNGHKCGPTYCLRIWKEVCAIYSKINTSWTESCNNIIKRMKTSAIWMNLDTFNTYLEMMLEIENRQVIRKQEGKKVF
eukprot:130017_1